MTKKSPSAPPPPVQQDARIVLSTAEITYAVTELVKGKDEAWWHDYSRPQGADGVRKLSEAGARKLIEDAVRRVNFHRCGHPEGTIAYSADTGLTARRYWSQQHGKLMWLITEPAKGTEDAVAIDANEKLPVGVAWSVAHAPQWPVQKVAVVSE